MKAKRAILVVTLGTVMSLGSVAGGQSDSGGLVTPSTVTAVFSELSKGIEGVLKNAVDRLDLVVANAALEARATVNAARGQFDESLANSFDQLDGQQRRLFEDLKALNVALRGSAVETTKDFGEIVQRAVTDVRLLVSSKPGAIYVTAKPAVISDRWLDVEVDGTGLSKAQLHNFRINNVVVEAKTGHVDDRQHLYRVDMAKLSEIDSKITAEISAPVEPTVELSFREESWVPDWWQSLFGVRGIRGPFVTTGLIVPNRLGEVRAVFFTEEKEVVRRKQERGPFRSPRVKTTIGGFPPKRRTGRRTDVWSAASSDGWKIDVASAKFDFRLLNSSCSSRRSNATWVKHGEHILTVRAHVEAEKGIGRTCHATTTISFYEWALDAVNKVVKTNFVTLNAGHEVALTLPEGMRKGARLAHVEFRRAGRDGERIVRADDRSSNLKVEDKRDVYTVYVKADYRRGP